MASEDAFQESLAFLQKTNADGESVYDQLAKVVGEAAAAAHTPKCGLPLSTLNALPTGLTNRTEHERG